VLPDHENFDVDDNEYEEYSERAHVSAAFVVAGAGQVAVVEVEEEEG